MGGTYAERVITDMADQKARRDRSVGQFPCNPMCPALPTPPPDPSVAIGQFPAFPNPASLWVLTDLCPKPTGRRIHHELIGPCLGGRFLLRVEAGERLGEAGPLAELASHSGRLREHLLRDLLPLRHAELLVKRARVLDRARDPLLRHVSILR